MPTTSGLHASGEPSALRRLVRGSAGIAVAMAVMNVATYGFQVVAARLLGPEEYGAVAGLMALFMVVAVLQLGLQATAARRIAATPDHVAQIERVVLAVTYRSALGLGVAMLAAAPLVWALLRLDSIVPALLVALGAVPLTVMGGQAGILQGERRWRPLALVYLSMGLSRMVLGTTCILVAPSETGAMVGVTAGMFVPALVGWWFLRRPRGPGLDSREHAGRAIGRETVVGSLALLAFFVLSNIDIVVARNVLSDRDAGLYAGGLILTKAVLFLPQFVVVVAFPSMSTAAARRTALIRSLMLVGVLGSLSTVVAWWLSELALVFVGGSEYAGIESRLWLFAVLGTLLAMLQLLVYSVLARRGTRSAYLLWAAVVVVAVGGPAVASLGGLLALVVAADAVLFALLLALSLWRITRLDAEDRAPA